ncbi:hypothetical protein SDC9_66982 [bioreactor metagenome]|uniref:Uncharacterized protein n=1 Tax=bioreactor metagenome TaxID=1076179 RepID=A0A644XY15_9ZZZZ
MDSIQRNPFFCSNSNRNTSAVVITTPTIKGIRNKRFQANSEPMTSAMSVAMMASSVKIQRKKAIGFETVARVAWARSIFVAIPNLADISWNIIASTLDKSTTANNE